MHQGSVFSVKGMAIASGVRPNITLAAGGCIPSESVTIGSPMWINEVEPSSSRTKVLATWPGPGRQEGLPLLAKADCANGNGGCCVSLNIYPPSSDAKTAPASTLWNPAAMDVRHLMQWAIAVATPAVHSAARSAAEVGAGIRAAIGRGVPEWNAGTRAHSTFHIPLRSLCRAYALCTNAEMQQY